VLADDAWQFGAQKAQLPQHDRAASVKADGRHPPTARLSWCFI